MHAGPMSAGTAVKSSNRADRVAAPLHYDFYCRARAISCGSIKISPGNLFCGLRCRVTRDAIKLTATSMRDRNNVSPLIRRADVRPAVTA